MSLVAKREEPQEKAGSRRHRTHGPPQPPRPGPQTAVAWGPRSEQGTGRKPPYSKVEAEHEPANCKDKLQIAFLWLLRKLRALALHPLPDSNISEKLKHEFSTLRTWGAGPKECLGPWAVPLVLNSICIAKDLNAKARELESQHGHILFAGFPAEVRHGRLCVFIPTRTGLTERGAWARVPQRNSNQQRGWLSRKKKE